MTNLQELLNRCQQDDQAAFEALFQQFVGKVYRLSMTILQNEKDAEDAAQETLLRAYRKLKEYRGDSNFNTWLTAIAVNVCRDHIRRQKLRWAFSLEWLQNKADLAIPGVPEQVDLHMQNQTLWKLVAGMDEKYRLPLLLVYQENLKVPEVAEILGLPVRTVYARLKHAYTELSARLETPLAACELEGER